MDKDRPISQAVIQRVVQEQIRVNQEETCLSCHRTLGTHDRALGLYCHRECSSDLYTQLVLESLEMTRVQGTTPMGVHQTLSAIEYGEVIRLTLTKLCSTLPRSIRVLDLGVSNTHTTDILYFTLRYLPICFVCHRSEDLYVAELSSLTFSADDYLLDSKYNNNIALTRTTSSPLHLLGEEYFCHPECLRKYLNQLSEEIKAEQRRLS